MIDSVRIVAMTPAHIDLLMPFERGMFGPEAWTRGGYRDELADHRHRTYLVAESDDAALLGWAGVRVVADEAEVLTVGVVPGARRTGLARRLLAGLLDAAAAKGAKDVYLEVRVDNVAARSLYRSEGFDDVGVRRGYYEHGRVDAVVMQLKLAP
ncbi:ribosomal protein S18-alanine N-acetyltransferase [uncultured Jatrophihabitans sp.]|uniref:ribosomal protein S18-alanine N-acetyltransferase n=1 Tax=uncultured Jatrophihabitans sp. TaxID=1610747 RepID=UPI0035C9B8E0